MSKIVISGYYGFANAGDEAMLAAIVKALRSTENSVKLTVISGNPQITAAKYSVSSIHRFNPLEIIFVLVELRFAFERWWQLIAGRNQQA